VEGLLTVEQAAARLQVHPQTVRGWIRHGRIPAVRLGRRTIRIETRAIEALVERHRVSTVEEGPR
jgi:excisionase family DNA binding protein